MTAEKNSQKTPKGISVEDLEILEKSGIFRHSVELKPTEYWYMLYDLIEVNGSVTGFTLCIPTLYNNNYNIMWLDNVNYAISGQNVFERLSPQLAGIAIFYLDLFKHPYPKIVI